MKRLSIIIFSFFNFLIAANAQQAGDIISGTVTDAFGPVMMANVVEIDGSNRIIASAVTDMSGNFSFKLKNPKDKLRVTYVGYKTVTLPFNKTKFVIRMQDATQISEVTVTAKRKTHGSGLSIPEDEVSTARQSIDMKEFEGLSITTVDEALQGRIAGLDIVANSGNLGSGSSMRLRGVSTITGSSEPLVVVDGNELETNGTSLDGANEETFAQLLNVNPEDIESIAVLKDASATAIYGSKGANGVIEIKTKRGARGKTKVAYNFRLTATYQPEGYKMLNGDEYTMLMKEAYFNPKMSDDASDIVELNYKPNFSEYQMYNNNTDWLDEVKQVGWRQQHSVSLSGGGEKANFRISAGYDHETGSIIEQQLDRFTSRVNLDYFVSDRIKIETNISLTYTKNKKNYGNTMLADAYKRMPNLSVYEQDIEGNDLSDYYLMLPASMVPGATKAFRDALLGENLDQYRNPIAVAHLAKENTTSYKIEPEFKLRYKLLGVDEEKTRLDYEGKVVFNIENYADDKFLPLSVTSDGWDDRKQQANRSSASSSKSLSVNTEHTLTFVPVFSNKDHSLSMLLRAQLKTRQNSNQGTTTWGLPSGTIQSTAAQGLVLQPSTYHGQGRELYFTYSTHYSYKGRYMADFSVRRDGSTQFGGDQRWGTFPAFSVRWNIHKEPWFQKILPFVSMLSIRPGWGVVGRQPGREYLYFSKYSNGVGYYGNDGTSPSNIQLKNLKWEQKKTYNVGTDFGFFNDRITGDIALYWQYTSNMIMANRGIPSSSGYSTLDYQNVGDMKNIGWEFNLNGNRIIKFGKWSFDFNVTFASNKNQLTSMDETWLASLNDEFHFNNGEYLNRVELNRALGSIYGFKYKGVYQYSKYSEEEVPGISGPNAPVIRDKDGNVVLDEHNMPKPVMFDVGGRNYEFKGGDAIYEDINHDGQINEYDIVYLGSSLPKFTGGFGFKVNFGRFTWNNQFNFRYGNKILNTARANAESMATNNNQSRAVNWRWRVDGDLTDIPRAYYDNGTLRAYNWLGSDRFVEDGSFIRLNYSQISYSFNPKLLKRFGVSQLSVNISASNLFCLTKYSGADPEVGYGSLGLVKDNAQTPRAKSFTGGVIIQF